MITGTRKDAAVGRRPLAPPVLLLGLAVAVAACSVITNDPTPVVKRFWQALAKNDQNTMLDCLHPDRRIGADPFGCILPGGDWTLIISRGLGLELSAMEYEVLDKADDSARVQATGRMKVPEGIPLIGGTVRGFQLTHELIRSGRQWLLTCP